MSTELGAITDFISAAFPFIALGLILAIVVVVYESHKVNKKK